MGGWELSETPANRLMFYKATELKFCEGTNLEVTFQDGKVKRYDVARLFNKYPTLRALEDRNLFISGHLTGFYGIVWNDDIDVETATIYEEGETVRVVPPAHIVSGNAVLRARMLRDVSQKELASRCGIDQSDISKIERGISNPTVDTLERIAEALELDLKISFED